MANISSCQLSSGELPLSRAAGHLSILKSPLIPLYKRGNCLSSPFSKGSRRGFLNAVEIQSYSQAKARGYSSAARLFSSSQQNCEVFNSNFYKCNATAFFSSRNSIASSKCCSSRELLLRCSCRVSIPAQEFSISFMLLSFLPVFVAYSSR